MNKHQKIIKTLARVFTGIVKHSSMFMIAFSLTMSPSFFGISVKSQRAEAIDIMGMLWSGCPYSEAMDDQNEQEEEALQAGNIEYDQDGNPIESTSDAPQTPRTTSCNPSQQGLVEAILLNFIIASSAASIFCGSSFPMLSPWVSGIGGSLYMMQDVIRRIKFANYMAKKPKGYCKGISTAGEGWDNLRLRDRERRDWENAYLVDVTDSGLSGPSNGDHPSRSGGAPPESQVAKILEDGIWDDWLDGGDKFSLMSFKADFKYHSALECDPDDDPESKGLLVVGPESPIYGQLEELRKETISRKFMQAERFLHARLNKFLLLATVVAAVEFAIVRIMDINFGSGTATDQAVTNATRIVCRMTGIAYHDQDKDSFYVQNAQQNDEAFFETLSRTGSNYLQSVDSSDSFAEIVFKQKNYQNFQQGKVQSLSIDEYELVSQQVDLDDVFNDIFETQAEKNEVKKMLVDMPKQLENIKAAFGDLLISKAHADERGFMGGFGGEGGGGFKEWLNGFSLRGMYVTMLLGLDMVDKIAAASKGTDGGGGSSTGDPGMDKLMQFGGPAAVSGAIKLMGMALPMDFLYTSTGVGGRMITHGAMLVVSSMLNGDIAGVSSARGWCPLKHPGDSAVGNFTGDLGRNAANLVRKDVSKEDAAFAAETCGGYGLLGYEDNDEDKKFSKKLVKKTYDISSNSLMVDKKSKIVISPRILRHARVNDAIYRRKIFLKDTIDRMHQLAGPQDLMDISNSPLGGVALGAGQRVARYGLGKEVEFQEPEIPMPDVLRKAQGQISSVNPQIESSSQLTSAMTNLQASVGKMGNTLGSGDMSTYDSIDNSARQVRKVADAMNKKLSEKLEEKGAKMPDEKKVQEKMGQVVNQMFSRAQSAAQQMEQDGTSGLLTGRGGADGEPKKDKDVEVTKSSAQPAAAGGEKKKKKFEMSDFFETGDGVDATKGREVASEKTMDESIDEYEVNENDINKNDAVSIWRVISTRYLKSYDRIFDERPNFVEEDRNPASDDEAKLQKDEDEKKPKTQSKAPESMEEKEKTKL